MNVIWKYELKSKTSDLEIPRGGSVLCVQMQGQYPCLWVLVDREKPTILRRFTAIATGEDFDGLGVYLGTVQVPNAFAGAVTNPLFVTTPTIVHHIFERSVK